MSNTFHMPRGVCVTRGPSGGSVHPQGRLYLPLLVHDGMVGYGFAWDDGAQHEEVFIDDHKELTVLTSKPKAVEDSLARYGLARIDGLSGRPLRTLCFRRFHFLDGG